jgi:hypothetical protein
LNTYFDSVNDFDTTTLIDFSNITSVEPTVIIDGFNCVLLIYKKGISGDSSRPEKMKSTFIVRTEAVPSTYAKLSARVRLVLCAVCHGRNIQQFDFVNRLRGTDGATR